MVSSYNFVKVLSCDLDNITFHLTSKNMHIFFNVVGESCTIRVWDISSEPKFLFAVEKGIECITDKVRTLL